MSSVTLRGEDRTRVTLFCQIGFCFSGQVLGIRENAGQIYSYKFLSRVPRGTPPVLISHSVESGCQGLALRYVLI